MNQEETWENIHELNIADNYDTNEYNDSNRKGKTFKVTWF